MEKHAESKEQILISKLKNGSHRAFDTIYQMYAKRLYAYSIQYTKSANDAEDIVQEVFINLWKNRASIRQTDTLQSLLFIMAKHLLINAYRARLNHPQFEEYVEFVNTITIDDTCHQVEYEDFIRQFSEVLTKLPATQQRVIKLSRFKGLSNKDIAATLLLSEQTVKNQLSVGLKTLREKLVKAYVLFIFLLFNYYSIVLLIFYVSLL